MAMKSFVKFILDRLVTFVLNLVFILGLITAHYFGFWEIYAIIFLLLLGGYLLFKLSILAMNRWELIEDRLILFLLATQKKTLLEKALLKRRNLGQKPAYRVLRQGKFHELTRLPIRYLPLILKIISAKHNLRSVMAPSGQQLLEQSACKNYMPSTLFKIVTYYQLSPLELAQTFIKNHFFVISLLNYCTFS